MRMSPKWKDEMTDSRLLAQLVESQRVSIDGRRPVISRLEALWTIGDKLLEKGISRPHSFGSRLQQETHGAVTRAVIFRGAKTRKLFNSIAQMRADLRGIRSIQYYYDMLALIDDTKKNTVRLTEHQRQSLLAAARSLDGAEFRAYLRDLKLSVAPSFLGHDRRTASGLQLIAATADQVRKLDMFLTAAIDDPELRKEFRLAVELDEIEGLANMAIALAAPFNNRLYREIGPSKSGSTLSAFADVYNAFKRLVEATDDRRRARLRKYLTSDDFESLATKVTALGDDATLRIYLRDRKFVVSLKDPRKRKRGEDDLGNDAASVETS